MNFALKTNCTLIILIYDYILASIFSVLSGISTKCFPFLSIPLPNGKYQRSDPLYAPINSIFAISLESMNEFVYFISITFHLNENILFLELIFNLNLDYFSCETCECYQGLLSYTLL